VFWLIVAMVAVHLAAIVFTRGEEGPAGARDGDRQEKL
jgi:hypothetical protein